LPTRCSVLASTAFSTNNASSTGDQPVAHGHVAVAVKVKVKVKVKVNVNDNDNDNDNVSPWPTQRV
jgi:hypothetical protein